VPLRLVEQRLRLDLVPKRGAAGLITPAQLDNQWRDAAPGVSHRVGKIDELRRPQVEHVGCRRVALADDLVEGENDGGTIARGINFRSEGKRKQSDLILRRQAFDKRFRRHDHGPGDRDVEADAINRQHHHAPRRRRRRVGGRRAQGRRWRTSSRGRDRCRSTVTDEIGGNDAPPGAVDGDRELVRANASHGAPVGIDHLHVDCDEIDRSSKCRLLRGRGDAR